MTYLTLPSASISQSGNWGHFYPLCEKAFWQSACRHWERSQKPMWTQKEPGSQMFLLLHPHWSLLSQTHLDVYGLPDWLRIPETRLLLSYFLPYTTRSQRGPKPQKMLDYKHGICFFRWLGWKGNDANHHVWKLLRRFKDSAHSSNPHAG